MSKHPADRDLRTYRWATLLCTLGVILVVGSMAYSIKVERKHHTIRWGANCYEMSDGVITCPMVRP